MAPWVTTGRFVCWFVSCNANHMMQCRNRNRNFMMFAGIFGTKCALQRWAYDRVKRTHCHSSAVTSVIRVLYGVRRTLYVLPFALPNHIIVCIWLAAIIIVLLVLLVPMVTPKQRELFILVYCGCLRWSTLWDHEGELESKWWTLLWFSTF